MKILGIETSCDETAAAIVERRADGAGVILANIVYSQIAEHRAFGGVVPEIAARAHVEALDGLIKQAMREAGCAWSDIDAIAATAGPGLIGGLLVGLTEAQALALALGKPFLPINHLEGHALTARLTDKVAFPYLLLLISGGHTQIVLAEGLGKYHRLGTSLDDAAGECFDKTAKLLGLAYPGGPAVEQAAKQGRAEIVALPRPLMGEAGCDFSFSGLKTAVRRAALRQIEENRQRQADSSGGGKSAGANRETKQEAGRGDSPDRETNNAAVSAAGVSGETAGAAELTAQNKADICAAFQAAMTDIICDRLEHAFAAYHKILRDKGIKQTAAKPVLVAAGGVAANGAVRAAVQNLCAAQGFAFIAPPLALCSDNAAMIAWAAAEYIAADSVAGRAAEFAAAPRARWPLDETAAPKIGSGRKGAKA